MALGDDEQEPPPPPIRAAVLNGAQEELATAHRQRELDQQREADELTRLAQIHEWRRDYAAQVFNLIKWWLYTDVALVIFYGFGADIHFAVDKSVIIAFITSTTVTVIGLFAIVMRWLFPGPDEHKKAKGEEPPKDSP